MNADEMYKTIEKLQAKIDDLTRENQKLRDRLADQPLLVMGKETDLYPGEIKDIILSTLSESINTDRSRRNDVLHDIIDNNHYAELGKNRMTKLKQVLRKYDGMNRKMKSSLEEFGIAVSVSGHNKHFVGTYYHDERYKIIFPSTPSDHRTGLNLTSNVIRVCM